MTKIKCLVEECKFNNSYACAANQVEVRSCGTTQVCNATETACQTFEK